MFRFRRRVIAYLDNIEEQTTSTRLSVKQIGRDLGVIMSNQEVFDNYAAQVAEQNRQIKAAVGVILAEIGRLQAEAVAVAEKPLDTSKMEEAISTLTAAVDEVEAIPAPVVEEAAPVEVPVEEPVEAPVEAEAPVEEPVEAPVDPEGSTSEEA